MTRTPRARHIRLLDVARETGVSPAVASVVLNDRRSTVRVSDATRERVLAVARRLGYRPDSSSHPHPGGRSFLIGLASLECNGMILAPVVRGIQEALRAGRRSLVVEIHRDIPSQKLAIDRLLQRQVEGLIVNMAFSGRGTADTTFLARAAKEKIPVIETFGHRLAGYASVNIDNGECARLLVRHFLETGHRAITALTHIDPHRHAQPQEAALHWTAWEFLRGYEDAMRKAGLTPTILTHKVPPTTGDKLAESGLFTAGVTAALALHNHPQPPTAVLCQTAFLAAGLVSGLRDEGIIVPDQIAVGCQDELGAGLVGTPHLTVAGYDLIEFGHLVVRQLNALRRGQPAKAILVPSRLVIRKSSSTGMTTRQ